MLLFAITHYIPSLEKTAHTNLENPPQMRYGEPLSNTETKIKYKNVSILQGVAIIRQRLHRAVQKYTGSPLRMFVSQEKSIQLPNRSSLFLNRNQH